MTIHFKRKDDTYPLSGICSYSPSKRMQKPSVKLYDWFLEKKNIDVKIKEPKHVFFDSICSFCESNDLNTKEALNFKAYKKNGLNFLEIEQSTSSNEPMDLDNSIYAKIIYEKNNNLNLSVHQLNTLKQAHELYRKNIQTVMSATKARLAEEGNLKELKKVEKEEQKLLKNTI